MIPARFKHPARNNVAGCLVYIVVVPVLSMFIMCLLYLPVFGLIQWADLPKEVGTVFGLVAFPLVLIWVVRFAARDLRNRASTEVVVDHDRIELTTGGKHREIPFEEVYSIRLVRARGGMACILELVSYERIRLPDEISLYAQLREPMEATLIPHLADRMPDRLEEEQEVSLRESPIIGGLRTMRGVAAILFATLLYLSIFSRAAGRALINHGWMLLGQGRLGRRGGFVVRPEGILARQAFHPVLWSEIVMVRRDDCGILLQVADGTEMSASSLARNWWPVARWIEDLCTKDFER